MRIIKILILTIIIVTLKTNNILAITEGDNKSEEILKTKLAILKNTSQIK